MSTVIEEVFVEGGSIFKVNDSPNWRMSYKLRGGKLVWASARTPDKDTALKKLQWIIDVCRED